MKGTNMNYQIKLPSDQRVMTIRELLEQEWLVPRKVRHFLRVRKHVMVNGEVAKFHEEIHPHDTISLELAEEDYHFQEIPLGDPKIEVLFEDEHLLIANKPFGIKTHPNQPGETGTFFNNVQAYLAQKQERGYIVHRLDKETSGVVLFAKNPLVLPILGRLLEQKEIKRTYQAIVKGIVTRDQTINLAIGRDRHDRRKRVVDPRNGQTAITHVKVIKPLTQKTALECQLETGRTHQIRVHLQAIGHPIIGDPLYGKPADRLYLHAKQIELLHPFTKEHLKIETKNSLFYE